ncbi:MAG: ATP-binding protein, partial [Nevskiales bacterium]
MPQGGTLTVALAAENGNWRISFADTGHGLAPAQRDKIFEPFQSGFEGGTGLGLAEVYQIVQS